MRSGVTIQIEETQGAVHDWILYQYTNAQYANELAEDAYQSLIQQLQMFSQTGVSQNWQSTNNKLTNLTKSLKNAMINL